MKKLQQQKFYVYEHWRPDKNEPFWVGKGHGKAPHLQRFDPLGRNDHERCSVR